LGISAMKDIDLKDDHYCFACGERNPDGLGLRFQYPEAGRSRAEFTPERKYQGWSGILHGGIIATLLDEAMAHAAGGAARGSGDYAVTAEMKLKFKKPVRTGEKTVLEGRVTGVKGRLIECASVLRDMAGNELAEATGKLIKL